MAIDHYSKWCEIKAMMDRDIEMIAKVLGSEVICRFGGVLKYIPINNGIKWFVELDQLCKNYDIIHQYSMLQWPRCNAMVERLVKTLKHGLMCFLQLLSMHKTRMTNYPRSCLDTNVGCK